MSEIMKPLTREERLERIRDIRERKDHLLGRGFVKEFYRPRNSQEEARIIDAGGVTYGL